MSRRDRILAVVGLVLGGFLIGWLVVCAAGDDEPDTEVSTSTLASTSAPSTTTADPQPEATATIPTAPSTTTTTTNPVTTTVPPVVPPPAASARTGEILGLALGTPPEAVITAMTAVYGEPGSDTGWNGGCPLDGGPDDHERVVAYGSLRLRFDRWDQPEQLAGWGYTRGEDGTVAADGPTLDDIELHPGVTWDMTGNEVAGALGVDIQSDDVFGFTFIGQAEAGYRSEGLDGQGRLFHVGYLAGDICE